MSLRLNLRGNTWHVTGTVRGRSLRRSTGVPKDRKADAEAIRIRWEGELLDRSLFGDAQVATFTEAATLYLRHTEVSDNTRRYLKRLVDHFIGKKLKDFDQLALDAAALALLPGAKPETRNRQIYTPAIAVHHFASKRKLCSAIRWERPKQKRRRSRPVKRETAALLLDATEGFQHLFLLLLFKCGPRVTEAVSLVWRQIDLARREIWLDETKENKDRVTWMDPELFEAFANHPGPRDEDAKVFPWQDRHDVYDWLRPLTEALGVTFTPHMARHSFATWLRQDGHDRPFIQRAGGWKDAKSAAIYDEVADADVQKSLMAPRPIRTKSAQ